jgi:hypothetical protein
MSAISTARPRLGTRRIDSTGIECTKAESFAGFSTESDMMITFCSMLIRKGIWGCSRTRAEFQFPGGRTDALATTPGGHLFAFEGKLKRWQDAAHQAYRATAFADSAVVVLPLDLARRAASSRGVFLSLGVGLCGVDSNRIVSFVRAPRCYTIRPWIRSRALAFVYSCEYDNASTCRR